MPASQSHAHGTLHPYLCTGLSALHSWGEVGGAVEVACLEDQDRLETDREADKSTQGQQDHKS